MSDICVIVPSRGRPANIARLIQAWRDTRATAELHIMLDDDDPELAGYDEVIRKLSYPFIGPRPITTWVGPRRRLGGSLNHLAPALAPYCHAVGFMGDDHVPRTTGWDHLMYLTGNVDGSAVVYGNDLIQGANLPTAVFMGSAIIKALGWFVIPGMTHLFMDNLWKTLGQQLGTLRYLPDVIIEHVHPIAGKAEWDDGYRENNGGDVWAHDEAIYKEWLAFQMPADIAKIRAAL